MFVNCSQAEMVRTQGGVPCRVESPHTHTPTPSPKALRGCTVANGRLSWAGDMPALFHPRSQAEGLHPGAPGWPPLEGASFSLRGKIPALFPLSDHWGHDPTTPSLAGPVP